MVVIIQTQDRDSIADASPDQQHWIYNGLDVCITAEVKNGVETNMDEVATKTYRQAIQWQAPFMDMMLNGLDVDIRNRNKMQVKLAKDRDQLEKQLAEILVDGMGLYETINARSHTQVKELLYERLQLPVIMKRNSNGFMAPASDRETLESLAVQHYFAEPIINHILAIRDAGKSLGFLNTTLDDDQKIRCSFNLAGTNTGRASSSVSDFGTGTNLQNVDTQLRYIFVPPKGRKFVNVDLEQADSRNVGALAWNRFYESHGPEFAGSYLDACESGDLHTTVCRMAWTDLAWPDDRADWRAIANKHAYRVLSYRDLAKKLGHGTNYLGQPPTMAKHTKVAKGMIEAFQRNYFDAFPCIPEWQQATITELQETGRLTNLFGRRRMFFGRHEDQPVINAAIAYCPQGTTGEEINHGIQAIWDHAHGKYFQLHVQVHDSILFSIPEEAEDELVPLALDLMKIIVHLKGGREFYVPLEAQTGWNWGYMQKKSGKVVGNANGLTGWAGHDPRPSPVKLTTKRLSIWDAL